jgi:hypothetical protein
MGDVRAELKQMLREFPTVSVEEEGSMLVASCPGENTFKVALEDDPQEITVFLAGYHQHFPRDEARDALGLFLTGLSDTCRLQVFSRGGTDYKWVVELVNFQGYWSGAAMLMNPFTAIAFWRKKARRCLQNTVVTRADFERLFPEARQPDVQNEPASVQGR